MNALAQLKQEILDGKHGQHVTLSVDKMSYRKALYYDPQLKKYLGFTDFPEDKQTTRENDPQLLTTQVLVFYVVGLDGKWKSVVAYYLTNHLSGTSLTKVTKEVLEACHKFEINV